MGFGAILVIMGCARRREEGKKKKRAETMCLGMSWLQAGSPEAAPAPVGCDAGGDAGRRGCAPAAPLLHPSAGDLCVSAWLIAGLKEVVF